MTKRIVITGLMALLMLFAGNAVVFSQTACGDVDGNSSIDIKDLITIYEYLYVPGTPTPGNLAGADMDPFPGVDFRDMSFFC